VNKRLKERMLYTKYKNWAKRRGWERGRMVKVHKKVRSFVANGRKSQEWTRNCGNLTKKRKNGVENWGGVW
jgi:hypothetical protein